MEVNCGWGPSDTGPMRFTRGPQAGAVGVLGDGRRFTRWRRRGVVVSAVGAGPVKAVCGEGPELPQATNTRARGQNQIFFLAVDWVRVL